MLNVPSLRVLDLGECEDLEDNLLTSIQKMFLLKYLCLGSNKITVLPRQLEELQYIETLDIRETNIRELPLTISRLRRLARLYVNFSTRFPDGIIEQLRSLEELSEFGVYSYEDGMSLQQFSQLTELKRLTVTFCIGSLKLKGRPCEDVNSCVRTLISSCSIQHLYFLGAMIVHRDIPVSPESWCPIIPCSLRKLQVEIYNFLHVPSLMSRLINLTELVLNIFCMRPEDVAILGTMPTLFNLEVSTLFGSNGTIVIRGFPCLKYLKLEIIKCGTAVKFEVGSMQRVEHLNLEFPVHGIKCVNGPCDLGIWHLPALTKIEIVVSDSSMMPRDEVISIVKALVGALSINPTTPSVSVY
jgi:Leucine-rich repeat (LRR) protein